LVVYLSLLLGFHVSYLNQKHQLNRLFFLFCILVSFLSLAEVGQLLAPDIQVARFWIRIGALWIFILPLILHFVIIFTENFHLVEEKINRVFALLYGPAFIFVIMEMTTNLFTGHPVAASWGWTKGQSEYTLAPILLVVWALTITGICLVLSIRYYRRLVDERKKKIAQYVIVGCWIILYVSIFIEGMLPELRVIVPEFIGLSFVLGGIFLGYAIYRFGFLSLDPALACDSIFSTLSNPMLIVTPQGKIERVNQATLELLGYSSCELIGKSYLRIFSKSDRGKIGSAMKTNQRKTGFLIESEANLETKGGALVPVYLTGSPIMDKEGSIHGTIFMVKDLSYRKRAEKDIKESELRYKSLFDTSPESITLIDMQGKIMATNSITSKMFGVKKKDVIGESIIELDFINADEVPRYIALIDELLSGKELEPFETEVFKTDVDSKWIEVYPSVLKKDGTIYAIQLLVRDITARKKATEEMIKAKHEAEEANKTKSQFLANMSHEIRTPMTAMIGMVNLIDETELSAEQQEYINIIQASSQSLLEIINNILDLSKLTEKKIKLESVSFDLYYLIEDIVDILGIKAAEKGIELSFEVSPDCPRYVAGDSVRLKQVLINIIGNGIKFTEEGKVNISVTNQGVNSDGSTRLHFMVKDTGPGIPEGKLSHIFDSFTQGEGSIRRRHGGTGLGLAISKSLVELMGGTIWAESLLDQGSTFHFTASMGISQIGTDEGPPLEDDDNIMVDMKKELKILVVEDNFINRKLILKLLKRIWSDVDEAKDGLEVLDALSNKRYDLILMDVQLADMDGLETTRVIRKIERRDDHIPIIALTAHTMKGDRERFLAAGMDDFISKPIDPGKFYNVIYTHSKNLKMKPSGLEQSYDGSYETSEWQKERDILDLDEFMTRFKMEKESVQDLFKVYIDEHKMRYEEIEKAVRRRSCISIGADEQVQGCLPCERDPGLNEGDAAKDSGADEKVHRFTPGSVEC